MWEQARRGSAGRTLRSAAVAVMVAALLAGCGASGSVQGALESASGAGASATQAALLAFHQYERGLTTAPAAAVALDDALTDLSAGAQGASGPAAADRRDAVMQDQVVAALRESIDAVTAARRVVGGVSHADVAVEAGLTKAADRTREISDRLEKAG